MELSKEVRTWAMLCHLSSLTGILLAFIGIPPFLFTNLITPLVVWLAKKDEHEFIDANGRESLNFQISMTLYGIAICVLIVGLIFLLFVFGVFADTARGALGFVFTGMGLIGIVIIALLFGLLQLALAILASLKAKEGQIYRYPFTIRFL